MDSKLVVEQLNGRWQIKSPTLKVIYESIKQLTFDFETISFTHIYRNFNKHANDAINNNS